MQVWHFDTAWKGNEHQISLNTWNLICARFDGSNIRSRLNSQPVSVAAANNVGNLSDALVIGRNYDGSSRFTGRLLDFGFINGAESDARLTTSDITSTLDMLSHSENEVG